MTTGAANAAHVQQLLLAANAPALQVGASVEDANAEGDTPSDATPVATPLADGSTEATVLLDASAVSEGGLSLLHAVCEARSESDGASDGAAGAEAQLLGVAHPLGVVRPLDVACAVELLLTVAPPDALPLARSDPEPLVLGEPLTHSGSAGKGTAGAQVSGVPTRPPAVAEQLMSALPLATKPTGHDSASAWPWSSAGVATAPGAHATDAASPVHCALAPSPNKSSAMPKEVVPTSAPSDAISVAAAPLLPDAAGRNETRAAVPVTVTVTA